MTTTIILPNTSFTILGETENYRLILRNFSCGNAGNEAPRDKLELLARQGGSADEKLQYIVPRHEMLSASCK